MPDGMIPWDEALRRVLSHIPESAVEKIDLVSSYGRVLAEDMRSDTDIPPFHKAAMDGYAVRAKDITETPATLSVRVTIPAGTPPGDAIGPGEAAKIMTGAPVPEGADAVVMVEHTLFQDGEVRIMKGAAAGTNICRRGEDIAENEVVLHRYSPIGAVEIAILASVGKAQVPVYRRPKVAVLSTGNEIREPGQPLGNGEIRNSNGAMLTSMARALGADVRYLGIARDAEEELSEKVFEGLQSDVLLLSGGVSMGEYDLVPGILEKAGAHRVFHKVFVKPGKPLFFAKGTRGVVFGIPGNPVSNFTTFHLFVKPALLNWDMAWQCT